MNQFLLVSIVVCAAAVPACAGSSEKDQSEKPPIIDVFACSDYCPGPRRKYMKKVYEGITDTEACLELGGEPYTYVGWGTYFVCIAKENSAE